VTVAGTKGAGLAGAGLRWAGISLKCKMNCSATASGRGGGTCGVAGLLRKFETPARAGEGAAAAWRVARRAAVAFAALV